MSSLLRRILRWPGRFLGLVRRQAALFVGAIVVIGFVVGGMVALDVYLHQLQIQEGSRSAKNFSYIISDETDRSLQSVAAIVSEIVDRLQKDGLGTSAALKSAAADKDVRSMMLNGVVQAPFLDSLYIIDSDGKIENPDSDHLRSIADLHGEDYLDALRNAPRDAVYVSPPFQSVVTGTWQLSLTKRLAASDGSFRGVVSGVVRLASFENLLEKLAPGEHGSVSIFRDDGSIIACFPQREIAFGSDLGEGELFTRLVAQSPDGVVRETSVVDGVDRMFAIAHSKTFPVASVVATATNDVVASWLHQVEALAFGAGVIVFALAFGAIRLASHIEQLAAAREREAARAQAEIEYRRFNNAMDNIVQGLAMYDRNNKLIACNRRYAEIYGLPLNIAGPGATGPKMLELRLDHSFGTPVNEPRKEADGSQLIVSELADGRIIAQRKKKLPDGGWVSTHEDITSRRRAEEKVQEMTIRDALTGLANRFEFERRLVQCLSEVRRRVGKFAVIYLDLDDFKAVNETLGHPVGDRLLQQVAARIQDVVRASDTVARLGGDEFAIIQRVAQVPRDAMRLAERLISVVSDPYMIDGDQIEIGASAGISLAPDDSVDADELMRAADMALYYAKADRGSYSFFQPSMDKQVRERRQMERDLRLAIAGQQFELHFQPIVQMADRKVTSFEALLRWRHPERGMVGPGDFIPLAEEMGLIVPIGEWVVREACRQAARWPAHVKVAINVSAVQFKSAALVSAISAAMTAEGVEGSRVILEVTESVMVKDAEQALAMLHSLRELGVAIAMDDFGVGYSSLNYLRRFPFDRLKIDRSFVGDLGARADSVAIVRAATDLAKALGMKAIAEGVETEEQFALADAAGCAEAQGFLFSRPVPSEDVFTLLGVAPREPPRATTASPLESTVVAGGPRVASFPVKRRDGKITGTASPLAVANAK